VIPGNRHGSRRRTRRKRRLADGRVREFDAVAITESLVCLNRTKATLRSADVDRFARRSARTGADPAALSDPRNWFGLPDASPGASFTAAPARQGPESPPPAEFDASRLSVGAKMALVDPAPEGPLEAGNGLAFQGGDQALVKPEPGGLVAGALELEQGPKPRPGCAAPAQSPDR